MGLEPAPQNPPGIPDRAGAITRGLKGETTLLARRVAGHRMKVTNALKMAVMPWGAGKILRQEQEELARYGEVAVPGETSLVLPEGKVIVSYRESIHAGVRENEEIAFSAPASLEVEVRPAAGGEPLELKTTLGDSTTVTKGEPPWATTKVGTVRVEPGEYVVSARADEDDLVEPAVLLG